MKRLLTGALVLLLAACGGGGGDTKSAVDASTVDLTGVWAGAWQGSDSQLGNVSGTWEATITQTGRSATGQSLIFGDIDCMDGSLQTVPDPNGAQVMGLVNRLPCGTIDWILTAANSTTGEAAGTWSNRVTGGGLRQRHGTGSRGAARLPRRAPDDERARTCAGWALLPLLAADRGCDPRERCRARVSTRGAVADRVGGEIRGRSPNSGETE